MADLRSGQLTPAEREDAAILLGAVLTDSERRDPPNPATGARRRAAPKTPASRLLLEGSLLMAAAVVVAIVLRTFVVGTYLIPSGSMEPTLMINDRIMVDKLSYHLHGVDRGDVVVFSTPPAENCGGAPVADLVKRVIGLPGETIALSRGQVYINGKLLAQPWLTAQAQQATVPGPSRAPYALEHPYKIPAGEVYVMGDNRTVSCDSRYWGPILESSIVGKVDFRIWPVSRLHFF
jgi:signal peptidase I